MRPSSPALLEETTAPITAAKLAEYLCEGGTATIGFNHDGTIDVGREQRLFTRRQRTALGVRDGGCRFPGCDKPPSWCEAHHVEWWARDGGRTDIRNGILFCRFHHMFIHGSVSHSGGWEIIRGPADATNRGSADTFWLTPPASIDPTRTLIEMPSRNPIVAAMKQTLSAS